MTEILHAVVLDILGALLLFKLLLLELAAGTAERLGIVLLFELQLEILHVLDADFDAAHVCLISHIVFQKELSYYY